MVVPSIPKPVRYVALFPELADMEAVGVPESTLMNANLDEDVEVPPRSRSRIVASFG